MVVRRTRGRTCSVDGCERKHSGRGYCDAHLQRVKATGSPGPAEIEPRQPDARCAVEGCGKPIRGGGNGLCNAHYIRKRKTGDPLTPLPERVHWWTGDAATYVAVHIRLKSERGRASAHICPCGEPAREWAYDHADPDVRHDPKGKPYSLDIFGHYNALCASCHKRLDASHRG